MDGAAAFVAGYATLTELASFGLTRVGVITANRHTRRVSADGTLPLPHLGSLALHRVMAAVATGAAVLLALVFAGFHHSEADLAVLSIPVVIGLIALGRTAAQVRAAVSD